MLVHDKTLTFGHDNERYSLHGNETVSSNDWYEPWVPMCLQYISVHLAICNMGWQTSFAIAFNLAKC